MLVATSSWAWSISRVACPPVDQFTASKKSSEVVCRASSVLASARKYSSSMPKQYSAFDSARGFRERMTTCPLAPLKLNFKPCKIERSNSMGLKPRFEKRRLPQPRMSLRAHFRLRFGKHAIDECLAVNSSLPGGGLREDI